MTAIQIRTQSLGDGYGAEGLGQDRARTARVHNYFLHGWDNYPEDRACADDVQAVFPAISLVALAGHTYADRVTRYLAGQGVAQFVEVGVGLPVRPFLHEAAQAAAGGTRVLYLDTDWLSLAYGDTLLTGSRGGVSDCAEADVRDPDALLATVEQHGLIDLGRPVGLFLHSLLEEIPDEQDPHGIVGRLLGALPSGSFLSLTHGAADLAPGAWAAATDAYLRHGIRIHPRPRKQVARFFDGLDFVAPQLTTAHRWHPEADRRLGPVTDEQAPLYAGVGRIP
ncbi:MULTISPECIES: SAM-dependent methyltransferase [unclassified Streptomyces]|uniref:SAM-dependent methyltransferase n=1 Tax=unclassified Streptomyces TaxID=2593676 RepID=UPI0037BA489C